LLVLMLLVVVVLLLLQVSNCCSCWLLVVHLPWLSLLPQAKPRCYRCPAAAPSGC
jgi:hypothetical protein